MLGISFAVKMAQEMGMPVSVCLGLGTNQSAHVGDSELSRYVDYINEDSQVDVYKRQTTAEERLLPEAFPNAPPGNGMSRSTPGAARSGVTWLFGVNPLPA